MLTVPLSHLRAVVECHFLRLKGGFGFGVFCSPLALQKSFSLKMVLPEKEDRLCSAACYCTHWQVPAIAIDEVTAVARFLFISETTGPRVIIMNSKKTSTKGEK